MTASRTTPTLWVLVIMTGPSRNPESSSQVVPVISPLPFRVNQPANTASWNSFRAAESRSPRSAPGRPRLAARPLPEISVVCPTSTPFTSVIAFRGRGVPSKGTPRSRARGFVWAPAVHKQQRKNERQRSPPSAGLSHPIPPNEVGQYKVIESRREYDSSKWRKEWKTGRWH